MNSDNPLFVGSNYRHKLDKIKRSSLSIQISQQVNNQSQNLDFSRMLRDNLYFFLLKKYNRKVYITDKYYISDFAVLKKLYHALELGVDISAHGFTRQDLDKLRHSGGIISYVWKGGKLPSIEFIREVRSKYKKISIDNFKTLEKESTYGRNEIPCAKILDKRQQILVVFNVKCSDPNRS